MGSGDLRKEERNGQSVIEILVGVALAAVFMIGIATIIAPSLQISTRTEQIQTQTAFATELEGNIKAWAANNWNNLLTLATGTGNYYYLNTTSSPFTVTYATTTTGGTTTSTETISFVQSTSTDFGLPAGGTPETAAYSNNVSIGDLLLVATYQDAGATLNVTDTLGDTFTNIKTISFGPGAADNDISLFVATTSFPGADSVTVAPDAGSAVYDISLYEYSGTALDSVADIVDSTSGVASSGITMTSGNLTASAGDVVFGFLANFNGSHGNYFSSYGSSYTKRELASGIVRFCNGVSNCLIGEDFITASPLTTSATAVMANVDYWGGIAAAIRAGTITSVGGTLSSGTSTQYVGQAINVGTTTYYRYFSVNDVYRDSNGNVTTTVSGNTYYDPSTKKITVAVDVASSTLPQEAYTFYLTRNANDALNQTNWAGGAATTTDVTFITNQYSELSDITVSATGSLQLSAGGGSCFL
jgi:hypothetical protein